MSATKEQIDAAYNVVNQCRESVARVKKELEEAQGKLLAAELVVVELQHGFCIGMVVRDSRGIIYKVTKIIPYGQMTSSLYGNKQKKDGEWSKVESYIRGPRLIEDTSE